MELFFCVRNCLFERRRQLTSIHVCVSSLGNFMDSGGGGGGGGESFTFSKTVPCGPGSATASLTPDVRASVNFDYYVDIRNFIVVGAGATVSGDWKAGAGGSVSIDVDSDSSCQTGIPLGSKSFKVSLRSNDFSFVCF